MELSHKIFPAEDFSVLFVCLRFEGVLGNNQLVLLFFLENKQSDLRILFFLSVSGGKTC